MNNRYTPMVWIFLILTFLTQKAFADGTETFSNIPTANSGGYQSRTWTGDGGIAWTSTDSRTDQTINGKAIGIRDGALTSGTIANGITSLSFSYKYLFTTGGNASLVIRINNTIIDTVAVPSTQTTATSATINNINVSGNFTISITETVTGARVAVDDVHWVSYTNSCTPPAAQASAVDITNVATTGFNIGWTPASGTSSLVVLKAVSAPAGTPASGTAYIANSGFGSGATIGTGEYVVYNGTGSSVTVSGLTGGTAYYVKVYSFDVATNCYQTASPAADNETTLCQVPAVQVSTINATPGSVSATVTWSGGDGNASLVKLSTTNSFTAPADGVSYTANSSYNGGEQIVYNGAGNSVTVSGLTASATYYVTVYTYSNCGGTTDYISTGTSVKSFTTTASGGGIPAGYYNAAAGQSCSVLKTTLSSIITTGHTRNNYGDLDNVQFLTTDDRLNDAGTQTIVWDIYSDNPTGPEPYTFTFSQFNVGSGADGEGNGWNKEHSFPNSWFSATSSTNNFPGADLHHIFPTDMDVNSLRSNYPYGEVATPTKVTLNGSRLGSSSITFPGYSGPVFEPIDAYKGDLARVIFYMVTRYQSDQSSWENLQTGGDVVMDGTTYPSIEIEYLKMLLRWNAQDPVSQKEIDRNNEIYRYQNNRNPYIDHPEYVDQIWSVGCGLVALPVELISFDAVADAAGTKLLWKTGKAEGFSHFVIERSTDGIQYVQAGKVQWKAGQDTYSFTDASAGNSKLYYRLRMVDQNAVFKLSRVVTMDHSASTGIVLYPNPANAALKISLTYEVAPGTKAEIADVNGRVLYSTALPVSSRLVSLPVSRLPAGQYLLRIKGNNQPVQKMFVVQH